MSVAYETEEAFVQNMSPSDIPYPHIKPPFLMLVILCYYGHQASGQTKQTQNPTCVTRPWSFPRPCLLEKAVHRLIHLFWLFGRILSDIIKLIVIITLSS